MEDSEDPYQILGVSEDATGAEIKTAYRKLALKHHPDKQTDESSRRRATDQFSKLSNAYEILSDPTLRQEYDSEQKQSRRREPPPPFRPSTSTSTPSSDDSFHHHHAAFHHAQFHDPFEIFRNVFGQEFGRMPSMNQHHQQHYQQHHHQQYHNQQQQQHNQQQHRPRDPFFDSPFGGADPFFGGSMFGGTMGAGMGGPGFMNGVHEMMQQQQQQQQQQFSQMRNPSQGFQMSSSSSSSSMGAGGIRKSISTTTRMVNGRQETVTETRVEQPDGTVQTHVETTGGEEVSEAAATNFQHPQRLTHLRPAGYDLSHNRGPSSSSRNDPEEEVEPQVKQSRRKISRKDSSSTKKNKAPSTNRP
eukprot:scaffold195008_cov69-Attheya_sp.AAC.2